MKGPKDARDKPRDMTSQDTGETIDDLEPDERSSESVTGGVTITKTQDTATPDLFKQSV